MTPITVLKAIDDIVDIILKKSDSKAISRAEIKEVIDNMYVSRTPVKVIFNFGKDGKLTKEQPQISFTLNFSGKTEKNRNDEIVPELHIHSMPEIHLRGDAVSKYLEKQKLYFDNVNFL